MSHRISAVLPAKSLKWNGQHGTDPCAAVGQCRMTVESFGARLFAVIDGYSVHSNMENSLEDDFKISET